MQPADGTGSATRVTEGVRRPQNATAITADGTRVVLYELTPTRGRDLRLLTLTPTPRVEPLLETRFEERNGTVSPDGRWLTYESNSTGRFEIYVRPFPNVGGGQWQVSSTGGIQPLWARSGRELFYVAPDGALMTVPVQSHDTTWSAGTATKLFAASYFTGGIGPRIRRVIRRPAVRDDKRGWWHGPDRRGTADHRRPALGRGTEAVGAVEVTAAPVLC